MRYLLIGIILCGIISCNQPVKGKNGEVYKTPVQYNNYIINRQKGLVNDVTDMTKVAQTDLDSADKMLDDFVRKTERMVTDIQGMPPFKGDTTFREAAIASFNFYKKTFGTDYKQLINIRKNGGDATEEGVAEMNKIVENISREEEKYDKVFHNAQKSFADKNHMRLESDLQKKLDKLNKIKQ